MLEVQELLSAHPLSLGIAVTIALAIIGCSLWIGMLCCCASSCLFRSYRKITKLEKYSTASVPIILGFSIAVSCFLVLILIILTQRSLANSFSFFENELNNQLTLSQYIVSTATSTEIESITKELGYTKDLETSLRRIMEVESHFNPLNLIRTGAAIFSISSSAVLIGFIISAVLYSLSSCGFLSCFISLGSCVKNFVGCFACIIIVLSSIILFISPVWCPYVPQLTYTVIYGILIANECQTDVVFTQILCQSNGELTFTNPFYPLYDAIQTEIQSNNSPNLPSLLDSVSELANCTNLENGFYNSYASCCVGFPWISFLLILVIITCSIIFIAGQPFIHWIVFLWNSSNENDMQTPLLVTQNNQDNSNNRNGCVYCAVLGIFGILIFICIFSLIILFTLGNISYLPPNTTMTVYTNIGDDRIATLSVDEGESITLYGSRNSSGIPTVLESVSITTFVDEEDTNSITLDLYFDPISGLITKQQDSYGGLLTFDWGPNEVTSYGVFSLGNGTSYDATVKHTYGSPLHRYYILQ